MGYDRQGCPEISHPIVHPRKQTRFPDMRFLSLGKTGPIVKLHFLKVPSLYIIVVPAGVWMWLSRCYFIKQDTVAKWGMWQTGILSHMLGPRLERTRVYTIFVRVWYIWRKTQADPNYLQKTSKWRSSDSLTLSCSGKQMTSPPLRYSARDAYTLCRCSPDNDGDCCLAVGDLRSRSWGKFRRNVRHMSNIYSLTTIFLTLFGDYLLHSVICYPHQTMHSIRLASKHTTPISDNYEHQR